LNQGIYIIGGLLVRAKQVAKVNLTPPSAGTNFVGTTDNVALEFKVNGQRALRLEPHATSPNVIGGYSGNSVAAGIYAATIGGGQSGYINRVTANFGTVGGGGENTASGESATVGGFWTGAGPGHYGYLPVILR